MEIFSAKVAKVFFSLKKKKIPKQLKHLIMQIVVAKFVYSYFKLYKLQRN